MVILLIPRVPPWKYLLGYVRKPLWTQPLQSLTINKIKCGFSYVILLLIDCISTIIASIVIRFMSCFFKSSVIINMSSINKYIYPSIALIYMIILFSSSHCLITCFFSTSRLLSWHIQYGRNTLTLSLSELKSFLYKFIDRNTEILFLWGLIPNYKWSSMNWIL